MSGKRIYRNMKSVFLLVILTSVFFNISVFAQQEEPKVDLPMPISDNLSGKFEIGIHYSYWSVDMIKRLFEGTITKRMGREIREEIAKQIRTNHISLGTTGYEQDLSFNSSGSNYGLEIRYYPQGKEGSFSLGLSFEKTKMHFKVGGQVRQNFNDGTYARAESESYVELDPFSTNLSFRWDMKPDWRATPYFILGFGMAALNGEIGYDYQGSYNWAGPQELVEDSQIKTLKEAEEDIDYNIPNIFFIFQASLGLRVEITPLLHLRAEAGFWDGFILRGGMSFRF